MAAINALSAETASAALAPDEPTIAGQCGHILFLLNFFDAYEQGQTPAPDWPGSWSRRVVDDAACCLGTAPITSVKFANC